MFQSEATDFLFESRARKSFKGPQLVLGGAQLGLSYGINNKSGMPSEDDTLKLLQFAIDAGIRCFDTARAYGQSERRIGHAIANHPTADIEIITKLDPLNQIGFDVRSDDAVEAMESSIAASIENLRLDRLDVLLLHRAAHRSAWNGAVWEALKQKLRGREVGRLGVSVQTPCEARAALSDPVVQHIQLPFNILDKRWNDSGLVAQLSSRTNVITHVRSALLQGLLSGDVNTCWPCIPELSPERLVSELKGLADAVGCHGLLELSLQYVRAQDWVDGIVIGVENEAQLAEVLSIFEKPLLTADQIVYLSTHCPTVPPALLNPALWPTPA